jgi:hypothetical protein
MWSPACISQIDSIFPGVCHLSRFDGSGLSSTHLRLGRAPARRTGRPCDCVGNIPEVMDCQGDDDRLEVRFKELVDGLERPHRISGGPAQTYFGPDVSGWVIEMWGPPGHPHAMPPRPERPVYWHGPEIGCRASNLNESVAVFPTQKSAVASFQSLCLPVSKRISRWAAVPVEDAMARGKTLPSSMAWRSGRAAPRMGPSADT